MSSVAENILTGTCTSPKLIAPFHTVCILCLLLSVFDIYFLAGWLVYDDDEFDVNMRVVPRKLTNYLYHSMVQFGFS
ncbi:hypothetical protein J15TS10_39380 [Paenibacillus woosongensis]|uniref:Uncharacterized protein n=1 Tax=Paenibacillus woosongensis TaxID=307580 RepID=A0ABQ4MW26_9BACL|nr:hypothetical protein J15TS10_39380 [Paenibacillus woosongensis]